MPPRRKGKAKPPLPPPEPVEERPVKEEKTPEEEEEEKLETVEEMKARHEKELKAFLEGPPPKGMKKKDAEAMLLERQRRELEYLLIKLGISDEEAQAILNPPNAEDAGVNGAEAKKEAQERKGPSKAQRRKAAKEAKEKARRAEIEEEVKKMADPRKAEDEALARKLRPLGLAVKEIIPDGHCLYRALGDQLALHGFGYGPLAEDLRKRHASGTLVQALRELARSYMQAHPQDFIAFLAGELDEVMDEEGFKRYCESITKEDSVVWGGQPEIVALASSLNKTIVVHSADAAPLTVRPLHAAGPAPYDDKPLNISFHKHYFGLGAHYNSLRPAAATAD